MHPLIVLPCHSIQSLGNPNAAIIMIAEHAADLIRFGGSRETNVIERPKKKTGSKRPFAMKG